MYYTYAYLNEDNTPYYVGYGKGRRIHSTSHRIDLPPYERRVFLRENLTKDEAIQHEKELIAQYGRQNNGSGILLNTSDGGYGPNGYKHTPEALEKISAASKGKPKSEEWKALMREKMKGKNKGKKRTEEQRKAMSQRQTGKKMKGWSDEAKRRQSERMKQTFKEGRKIWNKKEVETMPLPLSYLQLELALRQS